MPRHSGKAGWRSRQPSTADPVNAADNGSKKRQARRLEIIESFKRLNMDFVREPTPQKCEEWEELTAELNRLNWDTIGARERAEKFRDVQKDIDAIMRGEDVGEMVSQGVLDADSPTSDGDDDYTEDDAQYM